LPPELLLLTQICTKSFVGWGFAPDPTGELTMLPRPPSWFRGWGPREREGGRGGGKGGRGGEGSPGIPKSRVGKPKLYLQIDIVARPLCDSTVSCILL